MKASPTPTRRGFTLVELLVVIAIIGTLVGLLLPAVQAAREAGRRNTCLNNMRQLSLGLNTRESSLGDYPGYVNELGITDTSRMIRASWVVYTFPYVEQPALWERWSQGLVDPNAGVLTDQLSTEDGEIAQLEVLSCPSDPAVTQGQPVLAYSVNAGWRQRTAENLPISVPTASRFQVDNRENAANGVFFSRIRGWDPSRLLGRADNHAGTPVITMTAALIKDGLSQTVMLSENIRSTYWAYLPAVEYSSSGGTGNQKYHFGITWEQPNTVASDLKLRINGSTESKSDSPVSSMNQADGFPSSLHPGGVNMSLMDGATRFVADSISPFVYGQIMTSDTKKSDLHVNDGSDSAHHESNQPPVAGGDY